MSILFTFLILLLTALTLVALRIMVPGFRYSWLFVFSLVSLGLAILITSVVRPHFPSPLSWAGTLVLISLGMLAVIADNPLTLVLIWAAIDLVELIVQIRFVEDP